MGRDSEDLATSIENAITGAFDKAGDALAEFVETGKLDFNSLIRSIQSDLIKLSVKGAITGPLGKLLSGESLDPEGSGTFGGFGGLIGDLFGDKGPVDAVGDVVEGTAEATAAAALTAAGTTLTASGASLTASGATLTASGASLTGAGAGLTGAGATITASSATMTAAAAGLTASAAGLTASSAALTASGAVLTASGAALTAAAAALTASAAASGASSAASGIGGALGGVANSGGGSGFAHGGSFVVGGSGGVDQTNVGFKATRGEEVEIRTRAQQKQGRDTGGNITQIWHIRTVDDTGFRRNANQIMGQATGGIQRARLKG